MAEAFVYDHIRTPRGKGKEAGSLHEVKPVDLVVGPARRAPGAQPLPRPERVDDVVLGVVSPVGDQGGDIAKTAALAAGYPETVAGVQLNRFCASGLEAVNQAAARVRGGFEDLILAGGVESMSRVPMGSDGGAWALRPGHRARRPASCPQGIGADLIATLEGWTREDVDAYAAESHHRAAKAWANGYFDGSVVPVKDLNGLTVLDHDESIRPGTTVEGLAGLKPSFAQIGERRGLRRRGAGEVPLGREDQPRPPRRQLLRHRRRRRAGRDRHRAGRHRPRPHPAGPHRLAPRSPAPTRRSCSPAPPRPPARRWPRPASRSSDIDLFEINEAFAAVAMRFMRDLGISHEITNVNGGAIAMGHPLGATGAMILGTLIDELERRDLRRGLATLCVGGGMGIATIVERV